MIHKLSYYCTIIITVGMILFPSLSAAQQPTAAISAFSGKVLVSLQGKTPVEAEIGMLLQTGDSIEIQRGASASLQLSEGSQLQLGQNTRIRLADLLQTETGARRSRISLVWGRIRAFLAPGHQKEGSSFIVETPNAQVGVKFSQPDVEVSYDPDAKISVARAYTVPISVKNLVTGAEITTLPKEHQAIIYQGIITVSTITDLPDILDQMRYMPLPETDIGVSLEEQAEDLAVQSAEAAMSLLLDTRLNIGSATPATSQMLPSGSRSTDPENVAQPVDFTYTISIE